MTLMQDGSESQMPKKKQPKITLVELPPTSYGKLNGNLVKDIYTRVGLPARANPLLHMILTNSEYDNVQSINPLLDTNGKLTKRDYERIFSSNYLLLSAITRTIFQTEELAKIYHEINPRGKVIVGGPHVTFLPEEALQWADFVVRHEGDKTLVELMGALEKEQSAKGVEGVSYKDNGGIVHEPDRRLLTLEEMSELPIPFYTKDKSKRRKVSVMATSRGCPYGCDFCSVTEFYGSIYRRKSNESIIKELSALEKDSSVFFADDNFAGNKSKTLELLEMLKSRKSGKKDYSCQLSINSAFKSYTENSLDEEFLTKLKEAGFWGVYLGVESLNDETLKSYNKKANSERNKIAVKAFRDFGFWVHGMMMVGGDGDTKESLEETVEWTKKNLDSVQLFAPVPLPGTPFTKSMEEQGRILTKEYNLYDGFHVIIRPLNFSPMELQEKIIDMHKKFYSLRNPRNIINSSHPFFKLATHLYAKKIIYDVTHEPQTENYLERLKKLGSKCLKYKK